eukprot:2366404-Amphidinium_carterae.2
MSYLAVALEVLHVPTGFATTPTTNMYMLPFRHQPEDYVGTGKQTTLCTKIVEIALRPMGTKQALTAHQDCRGSNWLAVRGNDYTDCGHPCEDGTLHLRDEHGQDHRVMADMGCRNTVLGERKKACSDEPTHACNMKKCAAHSS